jgi:hypothetical protein
MLASLVAGLVDDPAATAERAGREWGGYLTKPPLPYQRPSAGEALTRLTGLLASLGFDPEVQPVCGGAVAAGAPGNVVPLAARAPRGRVAADRPAQVPRQLPAITPPSCGGWSSLRRSSQRVNSSDCPLPSSRTCPWQPTWIGARLPGPLRTRTVWSAIDSVR